jgi:CRP/FNR family cyclic AMP-dependent transcriptional regulator
MVLDPKEHEELLSRHVRRFDAGKILYREDEPSGDAFLLMDGRVRLFKQVGAIERSLRVVRPGELFGELALLKGSLRPATAIALDDVTVLALDPDTLHQVLSFSPELSARVLGQLVRRLRDAEDQVEILMLGDAQAKIVVALIKLAQHATQGDGNGQLTLAVSPLELSTHVGLDVDSVKRIVLGLRESGYLQIRDERVEIKDLSALRELYGLLGVRDRLRGNARRDGLSRAGGR